jgi:hypothetical protein
MTNDRSAGGSGLRANAGATRAAGPRAKRNNMKALRSGAVQFQGKPFEDEVLLDTVRAALER